MVSNVAEAESMSKSEQGGWEQFFEDYAALFVFLLTSFFFWHFVTKFVELSTIKNLLKEGF